MAADWHRLGAWQIELIAVVETTRDGFLVSIRRGEDGLIGDIIAVDEGRMLDTAFDRAMRAAEDILRTSLTPRRSPRRRPAPRHRPQRR